MTSRDMTREGEPATRVVSAGGCCGLCPWGSHGPFGCKLSGEVEFKSQSVPTLVNVGTTAIVLQVSSLGACPSSCLTKEHVCVLLQQTACLLFTTVGQPADVGATQRTFCCNLPRYSSS